MVGDGVIKSRNLRPQFDGRIMDLSQKSRPQPVTKLLRSELEGGWDGSISAVITNNVEESDWPVDTLTSQHLYNIVQDTRPRVLHIINIWEIFANGNHALAHDMAWRDSGSRPI